MAGEKMLCTPTTCAMHSAHERAIEVHDNRLDKHGDEIDSLRDCITRLTLLQERTLEWQQKADDRLSSIESVPAKRWNSSVNTFLTAIISALAGAFIATFSSGILGG